MVTLKVNFTGDRLVFHGSETKRPYEYIPARDNGQVDVDETDVAELISITRVEGCKCNAKDGGGDVQYITYNLFEQLSN